MTWSLRSVLLLSAMLWQALAMLTPVYVADRVAALNHFIQHSESLQHHHHDDQTLHLDDAEQSTEHTHTDGGFNSAGLITVIWPAVWDALPSAPLTLDPTTIPFPHHEGPLRPPRQKA
jgi:hypothetical protein